jgi:hypothetical protein
MNGDGPSAPKSTSPATLPERVYDETDRQRSEIVRKETDPAEMLNGDKNFNKKVKKSLNREY